MKNQKKSDKGMKIPLTHGQFATVDAADYEWLNKYSWLAERQPNGGFYAVRYELGKKIYMHNQIMGVA